MSTLRSLRERKGLTVSQLAAKSSIPSRVIADYEEGRQTITLAHAKVLAKALWVGIEDLMPPAGAVQPASTSPLPTPAHPASAPPQPPQAARPPAPPQAAATGQGQGQGQGQAYAPQNQNSYRQSAASPTTQAPPAPRPAGYDGRERDRDRDAGQRPYPSQGHHGRGPEGQAGGGRSRVRPAPPPPSNISEGQVQELERLAAKLEIDVSQLEERIGKKIASMTRPEAKDWIKKVRGMAEEIAPSRKAPYGQWPGANVDQEAAYLSAQKEAGALFTFKLFNGEEVGGTITDFTPYTITISSHDGSEMVLRKLAIAYYRKGNAPQAAPASAESAPKRARKPKVQPQLEEEAQAQVEVGIGSDRVGEPAFPETDNMDEDRGV